MAAKGNTRDSMLSHVDALDKAAEGLAKTDETRTGILRDHLATVRMWVTELHDVQDRVAAESQEGQQ
jgi:hypothetical protein